MYRHGYTKYDAILQVCTVKSYTFTYTIRQQYPRGKFVQVKQYNHNPREKKVYKNVYLKRYNFTGSRVWHPGRILYRQGYTNIQDRGIKDRNQKYGKNEG